jgi:hypothetical protein
VTPIIGYCDDTECVETDEFKKNLIFTPVLIDLEKEYTGNSLTCAIEERMRTQLTIDYSNNRWRNNIQCRRGLNQDLGFTNEIRKYFQGVELEFYEESTTNLGVVRNTLVSHFLNRTAPNTYTGTGITYSIDVPTEKITLSFDFRNRNENQIPAINTFVNGNPYLPVLGNQYWGGKKIFIKWSLIFYYFDWPQPFMDRLNIMQDITVRDYAGTVSIVPQGGNSFYCTEQPFCFEASIILANPQNYYLVNTSEIKQSGGNITESENFVPKKLAQQTSSIFSSQQADYTGGDAVFCINPSTFFINQTYKFAAMAKKKQ